MAIRASLSSFCQAATAFACLLSLLANCPTAAAAPEPKRVMLLHSFGPNFKPWSEYAKSIRAALEQQSPWTLDITDQSIVAARFPDDDPEIPFAKYLAALFVKHPLDLIVCIGAPAAAFVQRHRGEVFGTTPMIFTAVEQRRVQYTALGENDTVLAVKHDLPAVIENILHVLPNTNNVTVVNGTSPLEKFWLEEMRKEFRPFEGRIAFTWTNTLSFEDILKHAAKLPPRSAIFWELMIVDAAGVVHQGDKALAALYAITNAPIFSFDDSFFGNELVGGPMHSVMEVSLQTAKVAIRILGGEKAAAIKTPPIGFATPKYDWRQMQRWGISQSSLSPGSLIYFRDLTVWEKYRIQIVAVLAVLLFQAGLISWLIYEHWRRRLAETESLQKVNELARMNRFATAGELSASIAHEIRQPLAAISFSGAAGLNWLKNRVPDLNEVRAALQTIVGESHRADEVIKSIRAMFRSESATLTDVNLNEVVRQVIALTGRAINSNNIVLRTALTQDSFAVVFADQVQLQQVILNLILNAIEALSSSNDSPKLLRIETGLERTDAVFVTVEDSGPGFDKKVADNLFSPFVTTKPNGMGMGLTICKSIIDKHEGELTASSVKPRGAKLRIVLRRVAPGTSKEMAKPAPTGLS